MWFSDEKEARAMFQAVVGDFRQPPAQYDATIRSLAKADFAGTRALTDKFDRPEAAGKNAGVARHFRQ